MLCLNKSSTAVSDKYKRENMYAQEWIKNETLAGKWKFSMAC